MWLIFNPCISGFDGVMDVLLATAITQFLKASFPLRLESLLLHVFLKKLKDSAILIIPGILITKTVALSRINHQFKIFVPGLNESFNILHSILKPHVVINQPVK